MKRRSIAGLCLLAMLILSLSACERPLHPEMADATGTPLVITPLAPSGNTPLAPGGPATGGALPGQGYPGPGTEQAPAGAQETVLAETPPAQATVLPPATDVIYVVQAGDTLLRIAQQYSVSVEALAAANNITNVDVLDIGQNLVIPVAGSDATATPGVVDPAPSATVAPPTTEQLYIVQAGDTLYQISRTHNVAVDVLISYNNLTNPDRLEIGQEIRIPPSP